MKPELPTAQATMKRGFPTVQPTIKLELPTVQPTIENGLPNAPATINWDYQPLRQRQKVATTMTAREAIAEMRDMVSDRNGDYHNAEDALRYLNRAAQYVSNESESVRSGLYRPVIEGQGTYGMRADVLQIDFVGFKGQNENQYTPLTSLRNIGAETINRNSENARPIYFSLWGRSAVEKFLGNVVTAPADGAFTLNLDGTPTDLKAGDIIQNVSDREAQATLTSVEYRTNDILIQHGALVGGENTTIAAEDEVRISSPDQGRQTIHISPPPDFTSDDGEENLFILLRPQTPHHNPSEHRRHERRP